MKMQKTLGVLASASMTAALAVLPATSAFALYTEGNGPRP